MQRITNKRPSFLRIRFGKAVTLLEVPRTRYMLSVFAILTAIILIVYPVLTLSVPILIDQSGIFILGNKVLAAGFSFKYFRYAAVIMLLLAIFRRPGLSAKVLEKSFKSDAFTVIFFFIILSIAINSIILNSTNALLQAIIFFIYSISFLVFFHANEGDRRYFYKILSIALFIFITISIILYWPPQNRWMGGIHPNIYAQPLIIFSAVILFMTKKWRFIGVPLALFLAASVSSRYGMVAIVLSVVIFISLKLVAKLNVSVYAMAAVIILPLVMGLALELDFVREALKLDSATRGLRSGVSGRSGMIAQFTSQFEIKPWTGFGFRQQGEYHGAHNGYLNTILENGIIVSAMLFLYILLKYIMLMYHVVMNIHKRDFHAIEQRMFLCTFTVLLFSAFLQPQLINFGDIFGIVFILCLVYPVKLLEEKKHSSAQYETIHNRQHPP